MLRNILKNLKEKTMNYKNYITSNKRKVRVFLIAEAGVNHENSMKKAKLMIKNAANAGCDAIKFQTYKAKTLATKKARSYWDNNSEPEVNQFDFFLIFIYADKNYYFLLKL